MTTDRFQNFKERPNPAKHWKFRSKITFTLEVKDVEICFIYHLKSTDIDNCMGEFGKKSTIKKAVNVNAIRWCLVEKLK